MGLVNKSASRNCEWIGMSLMKPTATLSCTKWQSISMYFVRSKNVGLETMWIATWLSQKRSIGEVRDIPKFANSCCNQMSSLVVVTMALYSASIELRDMVVCFLDFQEIKESPKNTQNPVVNFLESGHDPQLVSENALRCREDVAEKKRPWPGLCLRYLSKWWAAWRWGSRGSAKN